MDSRDFPGDATAVIQGASRGIGLALTRALLDDGRFRTVVACSRQPHEDGPLRALVDQLDEQPGRQLLLQPVDATDEAGIIRLGQMLDDNGLRPSLVLNVAGLLHDGDSLRPEKRLEDLDLGQLQQLFAVNTFGPALMLRELLPRMARTDKAVFAAVSARVGSITDNRLGGWYGYRASKAALNQLLRTAAIESRRRFPNLIVAALHPGTTDTRLSRPFQGNVPEGKLFTTEFVAQRLLAVIGALQTDGSGGFYAWDGERIPW